MASKYQTVRNTRHYHLERQERSPRRFLRIVTPHVPWAGERADRPTRCVIPAGAIANGGARRPPPPVTSEPLGGAAASAARCEGASVSIVRRGGVVGSDPNSLSTPIAICSCWCLALPQTTVSHCVLFCFFFVFFLITF